MASERPPDLDKRPAQNFGRCSPRVSDYFLWPPVVSSFQLTKGSHNKIDFLKLPLELREAIYKLVLVPDSRSLVADNSIYYRYDEDYKDNDVSDAEQLDFSIVLTCKQIREEALNLVHRVCTVKAYVDPNRPTTQQDLSSIYTLDYRFVGRDHLLFARCKKLEVEIPFYLNNILFEYGQSTQGTVGYLFCDWDDLIVEELEASQVNEDKSIYLKFVLKSSEDIAGWNLKLSRPPILSGLESCGFGCISQRSSTA